ncbi:unnamed protein product [Clonostachys rhizophaga]|uniref:Uncharacterized protein n=1 Tax=Clonostachys rhizophaga TaxID=160324 RepID=A0A9N9YKS2_9HYPO|nr:unnamed protein product [Clonostachys rhizophaga]
MKHDARAALSTSKENRRSSYPPLMIMAVRAYQSKWRIQRSDKRERTDTAPDPFIIATGRDSLKPDAKSLKFIRHHAMRGKNRKQTPPRSHNTTCEHHGTTEHIPLQNAIVEPVWFRTLDMAYLPGLHPGLPSGMLHTVCKFIAYMTMGMYPVNDFIDLSKDEQYWLEDMSHDPLYSYTLSHIARSYLDTVGKGHMFTGVTLINKAMAELRKKFTEANFIITDSVLLTVLCLALISDMFGDIDATRKHLNGLWQLIKLRGGLLGLTEKYSLRIKCSRLDLRLALRTGAKPVFLCEQDFQWNPSLVRPMKTSTATPIHTICSTPDIRLVNIWHDLKDFTNSINMAQQTCQKLASKQFQEILITSQYRLQCLAYERHDVQEIIRHVMLAYTTTLFMKTTDLPAQCRPLAMQLRQDLGYLESQDDKNLLKLQVWSVCISRASVLSTEGDLPWLENWLRKACRMLEISTWEKTRRILKSFVWVDLIHGPIGQPFFEGASQCQYFEQISDDR